MLIDSSELQYLQSRNRDEVGRCFSWKGKILRAIYPEHSDFVKSLFDSGFVQELIDKNVFVESQIADYKIEGFDLVVEHKKIWPVLYPQEWTFAMLKDAAITTLTVAKIAKKYGLNMKDCHGLNILFDNTTPKFIDLGSFFSNDDQINGWFPFREFLRFYYYPLQLWGKGHSYVSKLSIFSGNLMPPSEYYLYIYPFYRYLNLDTIDKIIKLIQSLSALANMNRSKLLKLSNVIVRNAALFTKYLIAKGKIKPLSCNLDKLSNKIKGLKEKTRYTVWGEYHTGISKKERRFERIIELINDLGGIETAVDIGGNAGKFSNLILEKTPIKRVVCIDPDENSISRGYNRIKDLGKEGITFANYDFMGPIVKLSFEKPNDRFKSDIAVALALTHHLILFHGYLIDNIFEEIKSYARKYVFIEFMPLGLWVTGAEVNVPDWYNIAWFRQAFANHFTIMHEEKIAENNVIFVGKVGS
ncbi:MAG: class I SAM-dependent methyltransferase [Deltaproteobacteria bacterium]|nr:MAG: class I SAM-dependent methyltransferase [Deltaproteobacteria bacterium]